jgi:AmmeMemoRadiSam system protein A
MLVHGLISPHPPIIIPTIGQGEITRVEATIQALEAAAARLGQAMPETLIIIAPHEGHGFEVPRYYLEPHLPKNIQIEHILVTNPSYRYYYELGQARGRQLQDEPIRTAIVASGDLSHVLKADGPYGYHPAGPKLDRLIVDAVRQNDVQALLSIDPTVLDEGAECGLRSILFLLGALEITNFRPDVLSYEAPFGVGYLVTSYEPGALQPAITQLARAAIARYLTTEEILVPPKPVSKPLQRRAGAFVSLHEPDGSLRGCIGTIQPTKATLADEVTVNAIAAATSDPRFPPVTIGELAGLHLSVDVLTTPKPEPNPSKLDPKRFGIIITSPDGRQGILLPDLPGVTTADEQIEICRQKAGIGPHEPIDIQKFEVKRYEESRS